MLSKWIGSVWQPKLPTANLVFCIANEEGWMPRNLPGRRQQWFLCFHSVLCRVKPKTSLVTQVVKNVPAMWEARVWTLGQEDLLGKGMAIHSSVLAWRISRTEEPGGLQSIGRKESDMTEATEHSTHGRWTYMQYHRFLSKPKLS